MTKDFIIEAINGETFTQFLTRTTYLCEDLASSVLACETPIIVWVSCTDNRGVYEKAEIYAFSNFIDANDLLNKLMYTGNSVEVYQLDFQHDTYTNILSKMYDSMSYYRLAMIGNDPISSNILQWHRKLYDLKEVKIMFCFS